MKDIVNPKSRGLVVASLMMAMALAAMDSTIVATAIPSIVRDLGGFALFPWVFSIYLLTQAAMIPIYGKLADLFGRKPVLIVGALIFLLGSILSGLSWDMVTLIIFRGVQGIGAAAIQPIAMTIVGDLFTVEERAKMQGYLSSVWGLSAILGPTLGGLLVQYASWRWVFYINLPIGAAALIMLSRFLHEEVKPRKHKIDYAGSILLMVSIGAIITALLEGGVSWGWLSPEGLLFFGGGIFLLGFFLYWETRAAEPVLPVWVFSRRILASSNVASLALGVLTIGLSSYLPTFVQGGLRQTPLIAGFTLAAMSIGWPLASSLSGKVYLRFGFRNTAVLGSGITVVASVLFVILGVHSSPYQVAVASFVMGLGMGFGSTALVVSIQSVVPWNRRGVVTGANMFMRMLGSTLGVAVYGSVVNASLSHWFRHPPVAVAHVLPKSLNATTAILGGAVSHLPSAAVNYVRTGLVLGIHRVFWGILLVSFLAVAAVFFMPAKTVPLEFAETGTKGRKLGND